MESYIYFLFYKPLNRPTGGDLKQIYSMDELYIIWSFLLSDSTDLHEKISNALSSRKDLLDKAIPVYYSTSEVFDGTISVAIHGAKK